MASRVRPTTGRLPGALVLAAVAVVAFLPFLRGALSGRSFYLRDLSLYYFPLRRFVVEGLWQGELRYWNPYVHEGVQELFPPISYPFDLLQALRPHEAWFSLLLALHVPLAAVAAFALARGLGVRPLAAAGGGLVYALGGYALSTVNLYEHLQALAWAPLAMLGLLRAARGGSRDVALAALLVAISFSTGRVEIAGQTVLLAVALSWSGRDPRQALRLGATFALAAGLAAPTLVAMYGLIGESARGAGLTTDVVLAHSVHPVTFLQVVVGGLYGDLNDLVNTWWGVNFFPRGFPYILSLYLGLAVLCLALVGACHGRALRGRLIVIVVLGALVCLGRWGGLGPVVDLFPFLGRFRYPTKAFFSVHLAVSMLTAFGLDALASEAGRRAWRTMAAAGLVSGALLAGTRALPWLLPEATRWFANGFFPPGTSDAQRGAFLGLILEDAFTGALLALAAGGVALLVLAGRMPGKGASVALVAIVAVDLLRTGAGLNPMVTPSFFELSPEMAREADRLRAEGGRTFTCDVGSSPAYSQARQALSDRHEAWSFATLMETLTPYFSVTPRVPTAGGLDLTMLVPTNRILSLEEASCQDLDAALVRLRRAGTRHVLSVMPLSHADLALRSTVFPARIAPLAIHVYDLADPLPLRTVARRVRRAADRTQAVALAGVPGFQGQGGVVVEGGEETTEATGRVLSWQETPGRIEMSVEADRATVVVSREAWAAGWSAWVDGAPVAVLRADGRHCAVPVPAGRSRVLLRFHPKRLGAAALWSLASLAVLIVLARRRRDLKTRA